MAAVLGGLAGSASDGPKPQLGQQQAAPQPQQPISLAPGSQPSQSPQPQQQQPQAQPQQQQPAVNFMDILKILGSQK